MDKLWQVAVDEYRRNVFKKSFLLTLLSVPFFILLSVGFGLYMESRQDNSQPIGTVDRAGVLNAAAIPTNFDLAGASKKDRPLDIISFETEEAARTALEQGEIQAYFILPKSYLATRQLDVVYIREPGESAWRQFFNTLKTGLLAGLPPEIVQRAAVGADFTVRSIDGRREVPAESGPTFGLLMPLFIAMAVLAMLLLSSGYTLSAMAEEKENRTMEVLVTSLSPLQLIGGKIMGIAAISLTLFLCWGALVGLGIWVCRQAGIDWFNNLSMDLRPVIAISLIAIPAYVLAIALMTAIGVLVTTVQEGQSVSWIFFMLHLAPIYISWTFLQNPHNSQAVIMSFLPFTALMTVGMRNLFTIVPAWQIAISVAVQTIFALGAIWLASHAFHLGMLRYGQRLNLRSLFKRPDWKV